MSEERPAYGETSGGDRHLFEAILKILDASASLLLVDEKFFVLEAAWLGLAMSIRGDALALPGGFPAAQAEQFARLEWMAARVRAAAPNLEAERLIREGGAKGILEDFITQIRERLGDGSDGAE